jgi:hypothetical protein
MECVDLGLELGQVVHMRNHEFSQERSSSPRHHTKDRDVSGYLNRASVN